MHIVRFIFPFLFVRNWNDGSWELSPVRLVLFGGLFLMCVIGISIIYYLQMPVVYTSGNV